MLLMDAFSACSDILRSVKLLVESMASRTVTAQSQQVGICQSEFQIFRKVAKMMSRVEWRKARIH